MEGICVRYCGFWVKELEGEVRRLLVGREIGEGYLTWEGLWVLLRDFFFLESLGGVLVFVLNFRGIIYLFYSNIYFFLYELV